MSVRSLLGAVAATACALCTGCAETEQKFDIVPGPIGLSSIWPLLGDEACAPGGGAWPCIDELHDAYRGDYADLIRREAVPLLESFREARVRSWRQDTALMERWAGRQASLLRSIEQLDDAFVTALARCGVDDAFAERLRTERRIEVRRAVIDGHGPGVVDLRDLFDRPAPRDPETVAALDAYALQLSEILAPLQEAERLRLIRHRRIAERLEADAVARGVKQDDAWRQAVERQAQEEAAVPVRRAMARIMDLNLATLERLRESMPEARAEELAARFLHVADQGRNGTGGDPAAAWQVEIVCEAEAVPEAAKKALRKRLDRFIADDAALSESLLRSMRTGVVIDGSDPRRGERERLRKELLEAAIQLLPAESRDKLNSIRNVDDAQKGVIVIELAPTNASRLMARMPSVLRADASPSDDLPDRPSEISLVFLPPPADEAWLALALDRLELDEEGRRVAEQLWRDDALAALRALEPLHVATKAAESEIGRSLTDPTTARRALGAYFAAIDREREVIAAAEERYLDSLRSMAPERTRSVVDRLRWERRLARERIQWRFMPFADGIGFGPEAGVTAVDALADADLEPHEREVAEALLDGRLPSLVASATAFRAEGIGALGRLVAMLADAHDAQRSEERIRGGLPPIAASFRDVVASRNAMHREAIDEIASSLGPRGLLVRAAWRRASNPELFLDDSIVIEASGTARRRARGDEALGRRVADRLDAFAIEIDRIEDAIMEARRAVVVDSPARSRDEVRTQRRDWPELAMATAFRREAIGRLLRDLACMSGDPALRASADGWLARRRPRAHWIYE